jgi:hypothetical protein
MCQVRIVITGDMQHVSTDAPDVTICGKEMLEFIITSELPILWDLRDVLREQWSSEGVVVSLDNEERTIEVWHATDHRVDLPPPAPPDLAGRIGKSIPELASAAIEKARLRSRRGAE